MTTKHRKLSVRLSLETFDRIAEIAEERNQTVGDVVRSALLVYLATADLMSTSQRRLARVNEYNMLALDVIMRDQYPNLRERILSETDKLMEQFHGA